MRKHWWLPVSCPCFERFHGRQQQPPSILRSVHDYADIVGACTSCSDVSGTVEATVLTESQMPRHIHRIGVSSDFNYAPEVYKRYTTPGGTASNSAPSTDYTGGSQPHTHGLAGSTGNGNNLPPYFAMALIMRVL